jgi:hypothetical protein
MAQVSAQALGSDICHEVDVTSPFDEDFSYGTQTPPSNLASQADVAPISVQRRQRAYSMPK